MDTITRPEPLGEPTSRIEEIRNGLGFVVVEGTYLDRFGILPAGTYAKCEAEAFLLAIENLGSNEAIEGWIAENALVASA